MWLMEYTVTPQTYMLTALPWSCRGVKGSFVRDMELYSCSWAVAGAAAGCGGAAVSAGAGTATSTAAARVTLLLIGHSSLTSSKALLRGSAAQRGCSNRMPPVEGWCAQRDSLTWSGDVCTVVSAQERMFRMDPSRVLPAHCTCGIGMHAVCQQCSAASTLWHGRLPGCAGAPECASCAPGPSWRQVDPRDVLQLDGSAAPHVHPRRLEAHTQAFSGPSPTPQDLWLRQQHKHGSQPVVACASAARAPSCVGHPLSKSDPVGNAAIAGEDRSL